MGAPGQYQASATHRPDGRVTAHIHSSKRISYCTYLASRRGPPCMSFTPPNHRAPACKDWNYVMQERPVTDPKSTSILYCDSPNSHT